MSILETDSVLKTTDFDVHWFVNRQRFINPPALRLREPAVHGAWQAAAPGTNYPTATTLELLGRSASLLIKGGNNTITSPGSPFNLRRRRSNNTFNWGRRTSYQRRITRG
ncbi:hypothetical protein E4U44_002505 [Claviceps purpurea]|nr:hypothetical protein E4U44_002505 [Claviceps purpurea]